MAEDNAISALRRRYADLEKTCAEHRKRADAAEAKARDQFTTLNEQADEIARLSAAVAANQRELGIRRGAHPMYDRDPGCRNQYADRTVIETRFPAIFAKVFGLPPAIVLGEFKKNVAECLSRNYPKLRRSAARAIMRNSFSTLGRGPIGEAPSAHYRHVEDTLVMLDVLETLAYECSQQEETNPPLPGVAMPVVIDSEIPTEEEALPAACVRVPAPPLEPTIEPTAQDAEATATSQ